MPHAAWLPKEPVFLVWPFWESVSNLGFVFGLWYSWKNRELANGWKKILFNFLLFVICGCWDNALAEHFGYSELEGPIADRHLSECIFLKSPVMDSP